MKNKEQKWEEIMGIIAGSMNPMKFERWFSNFRLMSIDDEMKAVFVSINDPFRAAFMTRRFGANLDEAAEKVLGDGYRVFLVFDKSREDENDRLVVHTTAYDENNKVRAMLVVNSFVTEEDLISLDLADFTMINYERKRKQPLPKDIDELQENIKHLNRVIPRIVEAADYIKIESDVEESELPNK